MLKIDIVKELLKDLNNRELKEVASLILDRSIEKPDVEMQKNCQVCRNEKATLEEGISGLRMCYSCYSKIWREK